MQNFMLLLLFFQQKNKYKVINNKVVKITDTNAEKHIRELLDSSYQGVTTFFVFAYDNKTGNNQVPVDSFKKILCSKSKN